MLSKLARLLTEVSPLKACAASAVAHAVGLGILGAWTLDQVFQPLEAPGGDVVIQLQLVQFSLDEPSPELLVPLPVAVQPILVTPEFSRVSEHTIRHVSTDVTLPEQESELEPIPPDRLAQQPARPPASTAPSVTEFASADPSYLREPELRPPTDMTRPQAVKPQPTEPQPQTRQAVADPAKAAGYADAPPKFTYQPSPTYPPVARSRRWQGTVFLRFDITVDGEVRNVEVARSSGHPVLDGAAVTTIRTWRCVPRKRGGSPVASTESIPIYFRLR